MKLSRSARQPLLGRIIVGSLTALNAVSAIDANHYGKESIGLHGMESAILLIFGCWLALAAIAATMIWWWVRAARETAALPLPFYWLLTYATVNVLTIIWFQYLTGNFLGYVLMAG